MHDFAAWLLERLQRDEISGRREARFFCEFALGGVQRIFALYELTFRNRPGPIVLLRPERPTRMHQKNLEDSEVFLVRSEEHTSELQSRLHLVCRLLLEKKKNSKGGKSSRLQTTDPACNSID